MNFSMIKYDKENEFFYNITITLIFIMTMNETNSYLFVLENWNLLMIQKYSIHVYSIILLLGGDLLFGPIPETGRGLRAACALI